MDFYLEKKMDKKRNLQRLNQVKKHVLIAFNLISKNHLSEWQKLSSSEKSKTNLKADKKLSFEDINLRFIERFREYMYASTFTVCYKRNKVVKNYKINYIDKQIKTLKQIVTTSIESGFVLPFTWHGIKSEKRDVDTIYTDFNEIQIVFDEQLTKKTEMLIL